MYDLESPRSATHSAEQSGYAAVGMGSGSSNLNSFASANAGLTSALAQWLMQSLDHVGRGMLLVGEGGQVLHANRLARSTVAGAGCALHMDQGRLCAGQARDDKLLQEAISAALHRGLRRMLTLGRCIATGTAAGAGTTNGSITVAVLPIEDPTAPLSFVPGAAGRADRTPGNAVLISLPQSSRSKDLAVQIFAREQGCTGAETSVLEALLAGQTPEAIAQVRGVALCTVRTQIGQLRFKTGSHAIRELLDRVAGLPPMMVVVQ